MRERERVEKQNQIYLQTTNNNNNRYWFSLYLFCDKNNWMMKINEDSMVVMFLIMKMDNENYINDMDFVQFANLFFFIYFFCSVGCVVCYQ